MFTFNMCLMATADPYIPNNSPEPYFPPGGIPFAPAYFRSREIARNALELHAERKKVSVLRNTDLHRAVMYEGEQFFDYGGPEILFDFMENLSGREMTHSDQEITLAFYFLTSKILQYTLTTSSWQNFPANPQLGIEGDPGELDDMDEKSDDMWKHMKKWNRLQKKGKVTKEEVAKAFQAYSQAYSASRARS
jgi:hypothetical protein